MWAYFWQRPLVNGSKRVTPFGRVEALALIGVCLWEGILTRGVGSDIDVHRHALERRLQGVLAEGVSHQSSCGLGGHDRLGGHPAVRDVGLRDDPRTCTDAS